MEKNKYSYAMGLTTDEDLKLAQEKELDVVSQFEHEFSTDSENESSLLLKLYVDATTKERAIMDAVLIDLCGYSMGSIIKHAAEENNTM